MRQLCLRGNLTDGCVRGQSMCGFVGAPATAWHPRDLKLLLQMHQKYGARYAPPGFHSGYNEVVISSASFNAALPGIVDAFFVPAGSFYNGDASGVNAMRVHRDFLSRYHLTEAQVPLLKFTPGNWDAPFSHLQRMVVHTATRSVSRGRGHRHG